MSLFIQSCDKPKPYYQSKLIEFENKLNSEKEKYWSILEKYSNLYINSNRDSLSLSKIISECQLSDTLIRAASFVNNEGIITETFPLKYSKFKGADISNQAHVKYIKKFRLKFISRKFIAVQGFEAFSLINPIVENDTFLGTMNILIEPKKFIQSILSNFDLPNHSRLIFIQGDGEVLHSDLKHFENSNIIMFENSKDQLAENLIKTIGRRKTGEMSFFYNIENRKIKMFWRQIPMEKDKWTIVLINPI